MKDIAVQVRGNTIKDQQHLLKFVDVPKIELYDNVISAAELMARVRSFTETYSDYKLI